MPTQWWQFAPSDRLHVSSLHDTPSLHTRNNESTSTRRNHSASHTHHTSGGASGGSSLVHFTQPQTSASSSGATGITATPSFTRSRTYHSHIAHTPLGENYHVKTSLPLNPHDGLVYMEVQIVGIADHMLCALREKICSSDSVVILADEAKTILEPSLVIGICRELLPSHSLPGQDATSVGLYTKQKMIFSNSHKTTERVALPLCSVPPLLLESSLHQEMHFEQSKVTKNTNKQEVDAKEALSSDYQITRGNSSPTNGLGAIRSCSLHNQQCVMAGNSENRFHQSVHWAESTHANNIANSNNNKNNNKRVSNVHGTTRRKLTIGDVIGCLINFFDNTLHFTLNGELLEYSRKLDEKISLNGYYMAIGMQAGCPSMTFQVIFRTGNRSLCNVNQSLFHLHPLPRVECLRARSDTMKLVNEQKEVKNSNSSSISPLYHAKQQQQRCEQENNYHKNNNSESENKCDYNNNGVNADIVFDLNSYINAVAMKMIRHSARLQEEQKISVQLKEHKQMLAKLEEATFKRDNKEGTYIEPSARNTRDYLIEPDENQTQETVSPYDTNDVFNYKSNSSEFKMNLNFLEEKQEYVEELESYVEDKSVNDRAMVSLLAQFMSMRGMTHTLDVLQEEVNELYYGKATEVKKSKETHTSAAPQTKEEKENEQSTSYRVTNCQEVQNKEVVKNIALECALCHSQTIARARRVLFAHTLTHVMNAERSNFLSMWQSHSVVSPVVWQSVLHLLFPFNSRLCLCNCQRIESELEEKLEECVNEKEKVNNTNNKEYVLLNEGHVMQRIAHLSSLFFLVRRQDVLFMLKSLHVIELCCASLLRYISFIRDNYSAKRNGTNFTTSSQGESDFMPSNNNVNVLHGFAMNILQPFRALSAAKEMINAEQELCVMPLFSHDHILREMCEIVESMCLPHNEEEKCHHEMNKVKADKLFCAKSSTSSYSTRTLSHVMQTLNVNEAQEQFISLMQQMKNLRSSAIERIKQQHAVRATYAQQTQVAVQDQLQTGITNTNTNKKGVVAGKQNAKATVAPSIQGNSNAQSKSVKLATITITTPVKHNLNVPHTPQSKEKYKLSQQWQNEEEQYKQEQEEILDQAVAIIMAECIPIIDPPALPEQIYIAQTLNTFCIRVRSFFDCLQVSAHNSSASSVQDKEKNTFVVITEWCERWITLIQTALVQYRERVWSMLQKAIEETNESACQNLFYCILHKLQTENRKLSLYSLFENFTDSDDFYIKNFTNANGNGNEVLNEDINNNYYYSHVINIFDNYISKDTSRKHREVELLREFSRALMQLTNGSGLRSIWRTCHVKSILESAPQMPSNAFLNEMSAILHDLPPFYITQSFMTGKEEVKEHDNLYDQLKTVHNNISSISNENVQLSASRSPLKRPATPSTCEEQHTKAQRHLIHLHTRNKVTCGAHQEQHWSKNSPNEHRLQLKSSNNKSNTAVQSLPDRCISENISDVNTINENKCTSNTAVPDRLIDIDNQDVLEEEWHMDEFSLGAVYLHRIYKRLFQ